MPHTTLHVQDYVLDRWPPVPLALAAEVPPIGLRLERAVNTSKLSSSSSSNGISGSNSIGGGSTCSDISLNTDDVRAAGSLLCALRQVYAKFV
jgi:hypothetical protein